MGMCRSKPRNRQCWLLLTLLGGVLCVGEAIGEDKKVDARKKPSDPAARKQYEAMLAALRKANTLSFAVKYEREAKGVFKSACTYQVWLKKPNYFRMEVQAKTGEQGGVLVGDGTSLWIHWPNGRPKWQYVKDSPEDEKTRQTSYMTKPAPRVEHSIWHEARYLGSGMSYPILDVSVFHGHRDSIEPFLDGAHSLGTEKIDAEDCDKIEINFMDNQRVWQIWIAKSDHLPRRMKEVVHVTYDVVTNEEWSAVAVNQEIANSKFVWQPPTGWSEWQLPGDEKGLVKMGKLAPDFEMQSVEGKTIKLSHFRGKPVVLSFWRVGCPPCREEMPVLQEIHNAFKDKGLIVLAVDVSDDRKTALKFLRSKAITFPNIVDTSEAAQKICDKDYGGGTVPLTYVLNPDGTVLDAWFGFELTKTRLGPALKKLGLEK